MAGNALAQAEGTLKELLNVFQTYQANWPVEKAFLHLDKSEYIQGETIWIKSYLVAGPQHAPSDFSRNLYVELVDESGQVVKRLTLKSENGTSTASIRLLPEWKAGYYYLRSYTEWMKNSPEGYFFNKKIKVHSLEAEADISQQALPDGVALRFFPEGGNLVTGIASRVAFEVSGLPDNNKPVSGKVFDATGAEVTSFTSKHQGRGFFALRATGPGYYAQIDGLDLRFTLPAPVSNSAVLIANNTNPEHLIVSVKTDMTEARSFLVMVHTRGYVSYAGQINLRGNRGFARIPKSEIREGVAHITLFDMGGRPMAERLAFIEKDGGLKLDIESNKSSFRSRDQAMLKLKVTDQDGAPVQGSFSLSAIDNSLVQNDQHEYNLRHYLLLQSDLPGNIRNHSEFFEKSPEAAQKLDLLMMVNGWRRFDWNELEKIQLAEPEYSVERSLSVKGNIARSNNKAGVKNGRIFLYILGDSQEQAIAFTDESGLFSINGKDFTDTTDIMVQGFHKSTTRRLTLTLDTTFQKIPLKPFQIDESPMDLARLARYKESQMNALVIDSIYRGERVTNLGEVEVTSNALEQRERAALPASVSTSLGNEVDVKSIPYKEKKGKDPYMILRGRAPGYRLIPPDLSSNSDQFLARPKLAGSRYTSTRVPFIFIDGFQQHWEMVYGYSAAQIDYATVYNGDPGVISFRTLSAAEYRKLTPNPPSFFTGTLSSAYHAPREFYAPRHDASNSKGNLPDVRTTIFWEPMITTDENGEAIIDFYLPDKAGSLLIDVQGLANSGNSGSYAINIPVK